MSDELVILRIIDEFLMAEIRLYAEDLNIARALVRRDEEVTRRYFYRSCYPLFKSLFDRFYTGCESCKEFINEIYVQVMTPNRATGKCQLESFRGESTLTSWLKTVCLYYCYEKYEKWERMPMQETFPDPDEQEGDRHDQRYGFVEMDFSRLNREDVHIVLKLMPNRRYSTLIRLRYLEELSNEETAQAMGMSMDNYYNKHKLAKKQYEQIWRKEVYRA